jgi:hypothetical protein
MRREALPQQAADLLSEPLYQRPTTVRTEIVHDQVHGVGLRIAGRDFHEVIGELRRGTVRSCFGEVLSRLGLDTTEDVDRADGPGFSVPARGLVLGLLKENHRAAKIKVSHTR